MSQADLGRVSMKNKKLELILKELAENQPFDSKGISFELFDEKNTVTCMKLKDREELPIFMNVDSGQILCITYLFDENKVKSNCRAAMNEAMLMMNASIPLLAFSKIGNQYVMFGSLSMVSSMDEVMDDIELFSKPVFEAIDSLSGYLN